jgi:uncharacterized membrane protein SirB2
MSDTVNPWQSPNTEVAAEAGALRGNLTPTMLRYLKEASPWLRFLGILGYIGAVLLVIAGIILMVTVPAGFSTINAGIFGGILGTFMGVFYLAMGLVAFFPARFTHNFGAKIRDYLLSNGEKDLEEAFRYNRALWKFSGILAIVYLALIPLMIIGSIGSVLAALF